MADNEQVYIRPRRGTRTIMTQSEKAAIVLKEGELFIEFPDSGIGTAPARVKVGDGVSAYASLPYVIGDESEYFGIDFLEERGNDPQALINAIVSGVTISKFTANTKRVLQLLLTKFDNYFPITGGTITGNVVVTGDVKARTQTVKTNSVGSTTFVTKDAQSNNVNVIVPDKAGTLALVSDFPISDDYSPTSTAAMSGKAVNKALQTLDNTGATNAASKTIKSWKQEDGIVSVETQDIQIAKSQITGYADPGNGKLTITQNGTNPVNFYANQSGNSSVDIPLPDVFNGKLTITNGTTSAVFTANQANDTSINIPTPGNGKLTLTHGETTKTFTANQTSNVSMDIPVPGNGTFTLTHGNTTKSFSANQSSNVSMEIPVPGNGKLTITQNGGNGVDFYANQAGNSAVNVVIPTKLSDLSADANHRLVTDSEKTYWNNKSELTIGTTSDTAAAGNHTHTLSIVSDSGTSSIDMASGSKYKITAGGNSVVFKTPVEPTDFVSKANGGTFNNQITISSGGLVVTGGISSRGNILVSNVGTSTGVWSKLTVGNATPSTAAGGSRAEINLYSSSTGCTHIRAKDGQVDDIVVTLPDVGGELGLAQHTHDTTIAANSGTSQLSLSANTKYKLSTGGTSFIFTTPKDTTYESKSAASGGTDVSLCTTGEKYTWNNKQNKLTAGDFIDISGNTINVDNNGITRFQYNAGSYGTWYPLTFCDMDPDHPTVDRNGNVYYTQWITMNQVAGKINIRPDSGTSGLGTYLGLYELRFNNGGGIRATDDLNNTPGIYLYGSGEDNIFVRFGILNIEGTRLWTFYPARDSRSLQPHISLGNSVEKWKDLYVQSGTINTSDRNEKKDIVSLDDKAKDFILDLNPVAYKFKDGESGRTHYGLIAQDVEEAMSKCNMTALDFAGFCKDPKYKNITEYEEVDNPNTGEKEKKETRRLVPVEGEYVYGLRYEEFIAPLIKTVQEQQKQIDSQQKQIDELKELVNKLLAK